MLLALLLLALPARAAELIPMGQAVGIEAKTEGLLITGFADLETPEGTISPAKDAGLREGDVIRSVAGKDVRTPEDLASALETVQEKTTIRVDRGGLEKKCVVTPYRGEDGKLQLGLWLRDGVTGIGTVTWCDPATVARMIASPVCTSSSAAVSTVPSAGISVRAPKMPKTLFSSTLPRDSAPSTEPISSPASPSAPCRAPEMSARTISPLSIGRSLPLSSSVMP